MIDTLLEVNSLYKTFSNEEILKNINFSMKSGEILSIIGPSGSGKTTLMRCIVGLDGLYDGKIYFENKVLEKSNINPDIGMVFQEYNLFPHLNVKDNILIGFREKVKYRNKLDNLLDLLGIANKVYNYPFQLSGGEKQRVAIARALILNPRLICFDEPTSALDPNSIKQFKLIVDNLRKEKIGVLIITHDMNFAKTISNRIIYLNKGYIIEGLSEDNKIKDFMTGNL